MTTISIVVPAHNCRPWIAELLESIRAQTYPRDHLETIVVADGSGDGSAAIARSFLVRHAMQGTVLVGERGASAGAAMNLGWRAAAGEWIQFVSGRDVLAPNKIEVQAKAIPQLADDVSAVISSWQLLGLAVDQWLLAGPVHRPQLADPIVLKLLARPVARLGAGLIRKKAIVAVAGFSEDVAFALEQHFLLKIAGIGAGQAGSAAFVEASWPRPLFFERQASERPSRHGRVGSARQHLENALFARAILQQHGLLTQANGDALAALCDEGLRDLYACDTATFRRCARRLREIDRRLVPTPVVPRKYVEVLGAIGGRLTSRTGPLYRAISRGAHLVKHPLQGVRGRSAEILHDIESVGRGIAKSLAHGAGRLLLPRSSKRVAAAGTMIAVVLLGGILTLAALGKHGDVAGLPGSPERSRQRGVAPTIVVASTIYAEPASRWPMPIEVGPAQAVPPGSKLLIRGLPPAATLSEGRRVSAGAWTVAVTRLASLEVQVPAGSQRRSDLTLALVGNNDGSLAEAHTELSINEPTVMIPSAPAAVARPLTPPVGDAPPVIASSASSVAPPSASAPLPAAETQPSTIVVPPMPMIAGAPLAATGSVPTAPALGTVMSPPTAVAAPTVASTVADARSAPPLSSVPAAETALHASAVAEAAHGDPPQSAPRAATTAESGNAAATLAHSGTDVPPSSSSSAEAVLSPPPTATRGATAIVPDPHRSPRARGLDAAEDGRRSAAKMIARGERDLADGNIAVARQFLLRAAEAGLAHGALLLASTYDAYELARMGVRGVQANPSVARMWYERARELGASEAEALLLRLGGFD